MERQLPLEGLPQASYPVLTYFGRTLFGHNDSSACSGITSSLDDGVVISDSEINGLNRLIYFK